ncbi:hypothetical protein [Membranihabitans maritimus]|uniref:hypothetical protein n=1 Tax=Membranihabitans maritimus TaxID=2904244 RepID=UPI001F2A868B|nr:hypothetical protein [Membranihabitans maritimus]
MSKIENNINRRIFLSNMSYGAGSVALTGLFGPLIRTTFTTTLTGSTKKLMATTDYTDNVFINHRGSRYGNPVKRTPEYYEEHGSFMDKVQLDGLHKFLSSIGVTRHQWIVDTYWTLYEDYPHEFDLLAEAVKSAHAHGIELYAVIKPFEGGGFGEILPHSMPFPEGTQALKDIRGIFPRTQSFVAANPDLCLKRRPGTYECNEEVATIRLVKSNDHPTRIKAENLTIMTSAANNRFVKYDGTVSFRETVEWRFGFPKWRQSRILHLEGLQIPEGHKYVVIRCSYADNKGDFSNENGNILELVGKSGKILPYTLSTGPVGFEKHQDFYRSKVLKKLIPYLQLPEVQAEIRDEQKMQEHYRDFYSFGRYNLTDWTTLDKDGFIAAVCGKPEYMQGVLHPIYPEVREHWMNITRFCLDRNVDGVNFRPSSHTESPEHWEYGFNKAAIDATGGKVDFSSISRANGNAYLQFLREAKELIKGRGKSMAHHLLAEMLVPDDRPGRLGPFSYNFEWQWETWIKEIVDELEFRGGFQLRPWNLKKALDIFSAKTQEAGKPLYLQGDFHGITFKGPYQSTDEELKLVKNYPGLDGYVLYETANFTRVNDNGKVEGSPEMIDVLDKFFIGKK